MLNLIGEINKVNRLNSKYENTKIDTQQKNLFYFLLEKIGLQITVFEFSLHV